MELGKELQEFVQSTCISIQKGLTEGFVLDGPIKFDLAVVKIKEGGGHFRLHVLDAKGGYSKEEISRIKFKAARPRKTKVGNAYPY